MDLENKGNLMSWPAQEISLNEDGDCLLHIACQWGVVSIVRHLVTDEGCNINIQSESKNTPLHIACYRQSLDIVRLLLEWRCSTNITNEKGETVQAIPLNEGGDCLLHIVCQWGDVGIFSYLITQQEGDLNIQDASGNTPLHIACYKKSLGIVRLLLDRRCITNISNNVGETAQEIQLNNVGDYLLHTACKWGDVDTVQYLITDQRCNPNIQNAYKDTPLHTAIRYKKTAIVSQLLANGHCNSKIQNKKALHIACEYGTLDVVKLLISRQGCDLNSQDIIPLYTACMNGHHLIVDFLISEGRYDIHLNTQNKYGNTLLHLAVEYKWNHKIIELLSENSHPNVQNREGDTPLHIAVRNNQTGAISQVLDNVQCDPNITNGEGETPLHVACNLGCLEAVLALTSKKQITVESGNFPLHTACMNDNSFTVTYIIANQKCECDLNAQNRDGNTPLHIACYNKSFRIVRLLLERKCSTNIPNKKGETAQEIPLNEDGDCLLQIACQWGDVGIVQYLKPDESSLPSIQNTGKTTLLHFSVRNGWLTFNFSVVS